MNWLVMLLLSLFVPAVQPVVQTGVQRLQAKMQQPQAVQPQYVFHEGRWWKYEAGQWYVWSQTERTAWNQPYSSYIR